MGDKELLISTTCPICRIIHQLLRDSSNDIERYNKLNHRKVKTDRCVRLLFHAREIYHKERYKTVGVFNLLSTYFDEKEMLYKKGGPLKKEEKIEFYLLSQKIKDIESAKRDIIKNHKRCAACGILLGEGHLTREFDEEAGLYYCIDCLHYPFNGRDQCSVCDGQGSYIVYGVKLCPRCIQKFKWWGFLNLFLTSNVLTMIIMCEKMWYG